MRLAIVPGYAPRLRFSVVHRPGRLRIQALRFLFGGRWRRDLMRAFTDVSSVLTLDNLVVVWSPCHNILIPRFY